MHFYDFYHVNKEMYMYLSVQKKRMQFLKLLNFVFLFTVSIKYNQLFCHSRTVCIYFESTGSSREPVIFC